MRKLKRVSFVIIGIIGAGLLLSWSNSVLIDISMEKYEFMENVIIEKGRFQNIESTKVMQGMSMETIKALIKKGEKIPKKALPIVEFDKTPYQVNVKNRLSVVWFGHSSALIEIDGKLILTDPALSENAGPTAWTGTTRFHKAIPVKASQLPNLDMVLISHDHFDHLDKRTIKELDAKTKVFLVPTGVGIYLQNWGISESKIIERSWWHDFDLDGTKFISTPARHFSGRGLMDRNTTLWTSWVIKGETQSVYFSGDSGYQKAFKEIGEKYGPFDIALLECGQYNDDWSLIHMSPEESVQAGLDVKTKLALPIHWGAFNLSVHAWYEPVERFKSSADSLGLKIVVPQIGEQIVIDSELVSSDWWSKLK